MDEIRIPNDATYAPVALTDLIAAAPLASRLLLGATLPGQIIGTAAFGVYAGSAVKDWVRRWDMRRIDFQKEFGTDVHTLVPMPEQERREEVERLARLVDDAYTDVRRPTAKLARDVNRHLTEYIASITGQLVHTSSAVRDFTLAKVVFPFAMGVCDVLSGDVAIFHDSGVLAPHVLGHEFTHRKGYWKELHAQVLSYLSLMSSGDPVLVQAARTERLHRQLKALVGDDPDRYHDLVDALAMRDELSNTLHSLQPDHGVYEGAVTVVMKRLYDERLKLTGQNGISDYDVGFTNFLWTFAHSRRARRDGSEALI